MVMTKTLFALMLAGTLMVPHITPVLGNESTTGIAEVHRASSAQQSWDSIRLPTIPHLESMQWLTRGSLTSGTKVDMLWRPGPDTLGPFLLEPEIPPRRLSFGRTSVGAGGPNDEVNCLCN
jgi:hypothetical protein